MRAIELSGAHIGKSVAAHIKQQNITITIEDVIERIEHGGGGEVLVWFSAAKASGPVPEDTYFTLLDDDIVLVEGERDQRAVADKITSINTPKQLGALANKLGVRMDWHEPDEQEVDVRFVGEDMDNAMGTNTYGQGDDERREACLVLTKDGEDYAIVNVANLFAWASADHRAQRGKK